MYLGPKRGSKSGNCRTVSLWTEHISWVLAHSCPKNATVTRFRCGAEHIPLVSARWKLGSLRQLSSFPLGYPKNCFSVSSVQERLVLLASQLLPSTLIGSNNVQVARLVMGCHECIRACLGMFLCISSIQLETFIRRRKVVTWSRPRTKILPAASRGQWLTQHEFSWLLVHLEF